MEPNYECKVIPGESVLSNMVRNENWKFYAIDAQSGTSQSLNDKTIGTIRTYINDTKYLFCATYEKVE